ncbi:hypothetical protein D7V97_25615 [Corallococcus sp. CA053C]|uniref:Uncharacterized protein n=1 Tax=Corallococcus sicarius TaxID=2316726 RepID=A0A3A8NBK2_9BACT|nr:MULTISPECIES: hypothetical protein [Corallococcus]RKH04246.1 hypothetical protein D7V97_25615 [Corallococcus sp. CA053C]RKH37362.1 hypothetical protein D7X12_29855 [Corallococcus sicarius]
MSDKNEVVPPPAPSRLKRPVEVVRAELLADADVKQQAEMLKLPIEQYVEKILDYAIHPDKPPQLVITPDEELKARDPKIATVEEIQTHLQKIIDGEIVISPAQQRDGFSSDKSHEQRYSAALGASPKPGQPVAPKPGAAVDPAAAKKGPIKP